MARPFSPAELAAIARYLEQHGAKRCPDTGRGDPLPHLKERTVAQAIHALHRSLKKAA